MNHVIKKEDQAGIKFNINMNPVNDTHWKFLTKESFKGTNRPRTRNEIKIQLSKSVRFLHHSLYHTKKLVLEKNDKTGKLEDVKNGKKDLYDIFNAQTIEPIYQNLVTDFRSDSIIKPYKYDFRTSENARLMLEISLDYLLNSPEFKDRENTMRNVKEISEDFKLLSRANLSKEQEKIRENLSDEDEEKFRKQQEKILFEFVDIQIKLSEIIKKCPSIKYTPHTTEHKVIRHTLEQTREIILLRLTRLSIEPKKTTANKKEYSKLFKEVEDLEEGLKLVRNLEENETKMIDLERGLYKEIENYHSPINTIKNSTQYEINELGDLS